MTLTDAEYSETRAYTCEEEDAARDSEDFDSLLSRYPLDTEIAQFLPTETLDTLSHRILAECERLLLQGFAL